MNEIMFEQYSKINNASRKWY